MDNGWDSSAAAWIAAMGEQGDWGRRYVLDPAIRDLLGERPFRRALDVGCGEGRFCRWLQARGLATIGIDPTLDLLREARRRDPEGDYREGSAEALPFPDASFDLVVSYLTLIDIDDYRQAIAEMARVLAPGGSLLVANLSSFVTPGSTQGWIKDAEGRRLHYPLDRYLDEFAEWVSWSDIRIRNWHRPLSAYMSALLAQNLVLHHFSEPEAVGGDPEHRAKHHRLPWFLLMEWQKPAH